MAYPDSVRLHVTEDMRSTIEVLATRRKRDIERLLEADKMLHKMTRAELNTYADELFTLDSIIEECRQAGT